MEIYPILTGNLKFDGGAMFGVVPKLLWQKQYPADENNLVGGSMRCLLVIDGDRKILFDSGIGDKQDRKFFSYYYLSGEDTLESSLAKYGYTVSDITDHVLTHLHFDHCGGSIMYNEDRSKLVTVFPNATYWVSKPQWDWAMHPNRLEGASFLEENILPMKESGQLQLFEKEFALTSNIQIRLFYGHTSGQAVGLIRYQNRTIVNIADLMPTAGNISMAWVSGYDTQPLISLEEKTSFLKESLENDYVYFFYHDLERECCTLQETPKGIRMGRVFTLKELKSAEF